MSEFEIRALADRLVTAGVTAERLLALVDDEMMGNCGRRTLRAVAEKQHAHRHGIAHAYHNNDYKEPHGRWVVLVRRDLYVTVQDVEASLVGRASIELAEPTEPAEIARPFSSSMMPLDVWRVRRYRRAERLGDVWLYTEAATSKKTENEARLSP